LAFSSTHFLFPTLRTFRHRPRMAFSTNFGYLNTIRFHGSKCNKSSTCTEYNSLFPCLFKKHNLLGLIDELPSSAMTMFAILSSGITTFAISSASTAIFATGYIQHLLMERLSSFQNFGTVSHANIWTKQKKRSDCDAYCFHYR
jgi:hypothetical protein